MTSSSMSSMMSVMIKTCGATTLLVVIGYMVSKKVRQLIRMAFRAQKAVINVLLRRMFHGPLLPTWSLEFELRMALIKAVLTRPDKRTREERIASARKMLPAMRRRLDKPFESVPIDVRSTTVNFDNGVDGEWIERTGAHDTGDSPRVIYYLHGGGYAVCSSRSHKGMLARMAAASDARVFAINYRLAPENPFPAGLEDAIMGYEWLTKQQGVDPHHIAIAGDSAGGGLSMSVTLSIIQRQLPLPACVVVLSPWVDLEMSHDTWHTNNESCYLKHDEDLVGSYMYAGDTPLSHHLVSPIHADLHGFPPLLIQVGGAETLLGEAQSLHKNALQAGVSSILQVYDDMPHVFQAFPSSHYAIRAITKFGHFVVKHTNHHE